MRFGNGERLGDSGVARMGLNGASGPTRITVIVTTVMQPVFTQAVAYYYTVLWGLCAYVERLIDITAGDLPADLTLDERVVDILPRPLS